MTVTQPSKVNVLYNLKIMLISATDFVWPLESENLQKKIFGNAFSSGYYGKAFLNLYPDHWAKQDRDFFSAELFSRRINFV